MAAEPSAGSASDVVSGVNQLWTTLTGTMNVTTVVQIIGICLGACVVLALFWFGARYVTRKITGATKKGKLAFNLKGGRGLLAPYFLWISFLFLCHLVYLV